MDHYEILQAPFKYYDKKGKKERPVLSINNIEFPKRHNNDTLELIKITKEEPRGGKYIECKIIQWKQAGLDCQSTIRLSSLYKKLPKSAILYKRGELMSSDKLQVQALIRENADKMGIYD